MTQIARVDIEDYSGNVVATIKDFVSLTIAIKWSGRGDYQLTLSGFDDRLDRFADDYQIRVWYKDADFGLDWIDIFCGFVKSRVKSLFRNKNRQFQVFGPSLEELVAKEYILWYAGSTEARKNAIPVSTAMTEFVYENVGAGALASAGRDIDGVVAGLSVSGAGAGPSWSGGRSRKPLLQVLEELRNYSILNDDQIDWRVISQPGYNWQFQAGKLGVDRTTIGLNPATGLNAAGNAPVTFSEGQGNVLSSSRSISRTNALTQVVALGNGERENRTVSVAIDGLGLTVSPIARRVGTVTANTFDAIELQNAAQSKLRVNQPADKFTFQPRDIGTTDPAKGGTVLFRDYNVGDFITAFDGDDIFHKQVTGASITFSRGENSVVARTVSFADV